MILKSGNDAMIKIYSVLSNSSALAALVSDRIYPSHLITVNDPVYPCVTFSVGSGQTLMNGMGSEISVKFDVWSKVDRDELWSVYSIIRSLLNLQNIGYRCREISIDDDLFEATTLTYHLAARYQVYI